MKAIKYILICIVLISLAFSCRRNDNGTQTAPGTYYTCSMHPEIRSDKPGKCPVCKMELIIAHDHVMKETNGIMLTDRQIELADIRLDTARYENIGQDVVFEGKAVINPEKEQVLSSRAGGRIDRLYVKTPGQKIKKGDIVYEIYSEELISVEKEYQLAISNTTLPGGNTFIKAAEEKLKLWGLTDNQIKAIGGGKIYQPDIPVYSPFSGIVSQVMIQEGATVMEGAPILKLSDYSEIRVEAQVYPNEIGNIPQGAVIHIHFPAIPGTDFRSKADFVYPELSAGSQVIMIRADLPNPESKIIPGMQAEVSYTKGGKKALTVPIGAILHDNMGTVAWVRKPDKSFEIVMVKTGLQSSNKVEIIEGLKEGDIVVSSGAYLLNSEFILKKNADPMAGMKMDK